MIYPTIRAYADALDSAKTSFRTLRNITLELNKNEEPIFRVTSKQIVFNIKQRSKSATLKLFTHDPVDIKLAPNAVLLREELLVAVGDRLQYFDVILEERNDTAPQSYTTLIEGREDRVAFMLNNKWGFKNRAGEVIIEPKYDNVEEFVEGRTTVMLKEYYGLIDRDGNEIIEPKYDDLSYDNSHLCYVDYEGQLGVIDRTGREVVKCEWDFIGEFSSDMLLVQREQKYGYINSRGELKIELKYEDANSFDHNGYAKVTLNGEEFIIDKDEYRV